MEKLITYETLANFAYTNLKIVTKPIKGIVLSFFGLGGSSMYEKETEEGIIYAKQGILYVVPYTNPWSWMNKQAVLYTDEIIDVLIDSLNLPNDFPIVSSGGSMGGQSALVYTVKAKRTPVACVANCPVCDLPFHFTERKDLPRTLYSAFFNETGKIDEVLKDASPLHLIPNMPNVDYYIFHCSKDSAVNIDNHSKKLVEAMKKHGLNVNFFIVPEKGHCDLTQEMWDLYHGSISKSILINAKKS